MNSKYIIFSVVIFAICCAFYASAWTAPTAAPPNENASAPINVSDSDQTKDGSFSLKKFLRLIPGSAPTTLENGMAYYDNTLNMFKCRENGNWLNCVGGFFEKVNNNIIKLLDFGSGKVRITNVATPTGDENSDVATVGYVKDAVNGGTGGSLIDWKETWQQLDIKITPSVHDGNFGGWPGIDKFCQDQMNNKQCIVFSNDLISASYVGGSPLNFGTWDTTIDEKGFYGFRFLKNDFSIFYSGNTTYPAYIRQDYSGLGYSWDINYSSACTGYSSSLGQARIFNVNHTFITGNCSNNYHVICACPGNTLKRWKIMPTLQKHNGNFGGYAGVDKFCADQLGTGCRIFSNDILHSAYYNGPKLNYAEWDLSINGGWFGGDIIIEDMSDALGKGAVNISSGGCTGWKSTSGTGSLFQKNGKSMVVACFSENPVICACPEY